MEDKFYCNSICYYVCGNTDTHVSKIVQIAESFANECGVYFDDVRFEGVIKYSDWCKGFQLFSAKTPNMPCEFHPIEQPVSEYLKSR